MGNATRVSFQSHVSLVEDLKTGKTFFLKYLIFLMDYFVTLGVTLLYSAVVSCGWLPPPNNGKKEGTTYLQGAVVRFSCNDKHTLKGSAKRTCQASGQWSGEETTCVVSSMDTS